MTSIIAAICDDGQKDGQKAIAVADRKVIRGREGHEKGSYKKIKIRKLSNNSVFMWACGDMRPVNEIYDAVCRRLETAEHKTLKHQATIIGEEYRKLRTEDAKASFEGRKPSSSREWNRHLIDYDFDISILLTGVDDDGAKIWVIEDNGDNKCKRRLEDPYRCIGDGEDYSELIFNKRNYNESFRLSDALFTAYRAKRESEIADSVGKHTDMAVISSDGIQYVKRKTIKQYAVRCQELDKQFRKHLKDAYDQVCGIDIEFQDEPEELSKPD